MDVRVNLPFHQLLELVRKLSPRQRAQLKAALDGESPTSRQGNAPFISVLEDGPVYSAKDIERIEENRESIRQWRKNQL